MELEVSACIKWTVDDVYAVKNIGEYIESPGFTLGEKYPSKWLLRFFPGTFAEEQKKNISLFLRNLHEGDHYKLKVSSFFSIYGKDGLLKESEEVQNNVDESFEIIGHPDFLLMSELGEEKSVKVVCHIKIKRIGCTYSESCFYDNLTDELEELREQGDLTNIVIKIGDSVMHCHGFVLAMGSPVFKAMLSNSESMESKTNTIQCEFGFQCMQLLVKYLYFGSFCPCCHCDNGHELTSEERIDLIRELYTAADYYGILKLKEKCEESLVEYLDKERVFEILDVALKINSKILLQESASFLRSISTDEEWDDYLAIYDSITDEILHQKKEGQERKSEECKGCPNKKVFLKSLWKFFLDQELTDMVIKCGGKIVRCYEAILKASAPVLHQYLKVNTQGKEVVVDNLSFDCLMKVLEFVHTGKIENSTGLVELFCFASRIEISGLKDFCEIVFLKALDKNNAVDFLEASLEYEYSSLKERAVELILSNISLICLDEKFKNVMSKNLELQSAVETKMKLSESLSITILYDRI